MRRLGASLLLALVLLGIAPVARGQETMDKLYLIPIRRVGTNRGPDYVCWAPRGQEPLPGCIPCHSWSMMDYGFTNSALFLAKDITPEQHESMISHADVFPFPDNLDGPVDQDVQEFFEAIHLPTDWLTPSTTWRELLRQVAGMMQFNQRYGGIAAADVGEIHSVFDTATLETRLREMTDQEQAWFLATVESFGYDPALVPTNAKLRQLVKSAGDYWIGQTFYLGGWEF